MTIRRISPEQAFRLMSDEGYTYVDVRSAPEFESGHPEGAINIPLAHKGPGGMMMPNPCFLPDVQAAFATDAKIVVGCQSGSRSLHAAQILIAAGFTSVADQRAGFGGTNAERGWYQLGLPVVMAVPGETA